MTLSTSSSPPSLQAGKGHTGQARQAALEGHLPAAANAAAAATEAA